MAVYGHPNDYALIPTDTVTTVIVQEQRAVLNTTTIQASGGDAMHSWAVEVLIIVARGEVPYPSAESAANDIAANDYEINITAVLLAADLPDALYLNAITSSIGWLQWENSGGRHKPVYTVRVMLPVSQEITF